MHRRLALQAGLALGWTLAGPARGCEFFTSNLRVIHPWTRATSADAASAIVCMRFDDVRQADRLIRVETPVAERAELGGAVSPELNFSIPAGQESALAEDGIHVRLLGLKLPLELGRSYPLTLGFAQGDVISATLNVEYTRFR
jgi:copper(I)-binding protein